MVSRDRLQRRRSIDRFYRIRPVYYGTVLAQFSANFRSCRSSLITGDFPANVTHFSTGCPSAHHRSTIPSNNRSPRKNGTDFSPRPRISFFSTNWPRRTTFAVARPETVVTEYYYGNECVSRQIAEIDNRLGRLIIGRKRSREGSLSTTTIVRDYIKRFYRSGERIRLVRKFSTVRLEKRTGRSRQNRVGGRRFVLVD